MFFDTVHLVRIPAPRVMHTFGRPEPITVLWMLRKSILMGSTVGKRALETAWVSGYSTTGQPKRIAVASIGSKTAVLSERLTMAVLICKGVNTVDTKRLESHPCRYRRAALLGIIRYIRVCQSR